MADLTQDEAIERARAIEVDSYDVFLDLAAEPVLSRTEVRFRWLRPGVSTFAELRTQGVHGVTLDGVTLPPPEDGRLRLSRSGGGDQAVLVVEADAGYSQEGSGAEPVQRSGGRRELRDGVVLPGLRAGAVLLL